MSQDSKQSILENKVRLHAEDLANAFPSLMVDAERIAETVAQGIHGRRRVGMGETFWQYRRYHPGDPASAIDWRRSAKSQHVFMREHEWEAAQSVWIWRDNASTMDYTSTFAPCSKLERASLLATALASLLVRGGERIAILGGDLRPATGRAQLRRMSAMLVDQETAPRKLPSNVELPRHACLVLFSDFLTDLDELASCIHTLAARGALGHLVMIADPAEENLPFEGRVRFESFEGQNPLTFGKVETLRSEYEHRYRAHQQSITDILKPLGWSFTTHRTDHPAQAALLPLYTTLEGSLDRPDRGRQ